MKFISWQLVVIILVIALCVTGLELYAMSQGINGTGLAVAIGLLVAIPASLIARQSGKHAGKEKDK